MPVRRPAGVAAYEPDLYAEAAIRDPYPHYAAMRALGPVVWLPKHKLYAVPRYAEVKAVLRNDDTFRSGGGVALNTISRTVGRRSFLMLDGAEHDRIRKLSAHRLIPRALRPLQTPDRRLGRRDCACGRGDWRGRRCSGYRVEASTVGRSRSCRMARRRP